MTTFNSNFHKTDIFRRTDLRFVCRTESFQVENEREMRDPEGPRQAVQVHRSAGQVFGDCQGCNTHKRQVLECIDCLCLSPISLLHTLSLSTSLYLPSSPFLSFPQRPHVPATRIWSGNHPSLPGNAGETPRDPRRTRFPSFVRSLLGLSPFSRDEGGPR